MGCARGRLHVRRAACLAESFPTRGVPAADSIGRGASPRRKASAVGCVALLGLALLRSAAVAAADGSPPAAAEVDAVVAAVQARLDSAADFQADVHQEAVVAALDRTVTAGGTVTFKRPGKMRWEFTGDDPQTIVADGTTVWFYQPEDRQVLKAPLESIFRSTTPVSFLTGVGRIAEDFQAAIVERDEATATLALDPKRSGGDVGRLVLVVDSASFDIVEARVTDPLGNLTRLRFSNLRRNAGIEDGVFVFEIPPGVDVIDAPMGY